MNSLRSIEIPPQEEKEKEEERLVEENIAQNLFQSLRGFQRSRVYQTKEFQRK